MRAARTTATIRLSVPRRQRTIASDDQAVLPVPVLVPTVITQVFIRGSCLCKVRLSREQEALQTSVLLLHTLPSPCKNKKSGTRKWNHPVHQRLLFSGHYHHTIGPFLTRVPVQHPKHSSSEGQVWSQVCLRPSVPGTFGPHFQCGFPKRRTVLCDRVPPLSERPSA